MSSILTNNSAMVALQTLKSVNANLADTQTQISTGKSVANASDNSAVWAISKAMESDVKGFKGIQDSLALGQSTVAVARNAAETVGDLLTDIKGKIVAAQEENVDREKIQTDITALREQIGSVVNAAQFNGLNLLSNRETEAGTGTVDILSSLDRSSDGSVADAQIGITKQDLGTSASVIGTTNVTAASDQLTGTANGTATLMTAAGTPPTQDVTVDSTSAGAGFEVTITGGAGNLATGFDTSAGDIAYVSRDGDTAADVAKGIADAFNAYVTSNAGDNAATIKATVDGDKVTFTGSDTTGDNFSINVQEVDADENTIGGGLEALNDIDVSTSNGADAALEAIDSMIDTAINAASDFGSAQGRIDTQSDFISKLSDSLKSGIGSLVDTNMEEASARLQALQTQQQLAVQALSIANQAPQAILQLFR
ncbi:MAG: flagellin [Paracoccaceae bacterium]